MSLEENKSDLKLWLVSKYLDLFNLYKEEDVYRQNIEEAKVRLHDIRKMMEQGMITSNDVLRSELTLTNYELSYRETNNDIQLVSQQLTIMLGMDESLLLEPDTTMLSDRMDILSENDYVYQGYEKYPSIKISRANKQLSDNNLNIIKADFLPNLSLQAGNTFQRPIPNSSPVQDLYINTWGVSLSLSYKLSSLFDRKHSISAAKHQIYIQDLAVEQEKQNVRTNVKSAYVKHKEALDRISSLEKSVIQAKENYRIVKNKYYNQLAILTDLLDANTVLLDAELQLTKARTNAIYTYYQLQNASGNL